MRLAPIVTIALKPLKKRPRILGYGVFCAAKTKRLAHQLMTVELR